MVYSKRFATSSEGYRIELAPESRLNEILTFLHENFLPEETIRKSLRASAAINITDEELGLIQEDDDAVNITTFQSSPCLIVIHTETDKIVAVLQTVLGRRSEVDEGGAASAAICKSTDFKSQFAKLYYTCLGKIDREIAIFEKYPDAQAALEFGIISVHEEHRKKGLAKDLTRIGINVMAKSLPGVGVVFGVYSSIYSKKVAEQLGMKKIKEFDLETDFENADGEPLFRDVKSNNIITIMALDVASV